MLNVLYLVISIPLLAFLFASLVGMVAEAVNALLDARDGSGRGL